MAKKKQPKKTRKRKKQELRMDFISMKTLEGRNVEEKIQNILKNVKEGHLVVLDEALDSNEEARLVTATMEGIEENFPGIEFCSLPKQEGVLYTLVMRFLETFARRRFSKAGLTLVGPSNLIREIKRDPDAFYASVKI